MYFSQTFSLVDALSKNLAADLLELKRKHVAFLGMRWGRSRVSAGFKEGDELVVGVNAHFHVV